MPSTKKLIKSSTTTTTLMDGQIPSASKLPRTATTIAGLVSLTIATLAEAALTVRFTLTTVDQPFEYLPLLGPLPFLVASYLFFHLAHRSLFNKSTDQVSVNSKGATQSSTHDGLGADPILPSVEQLKKSAMDKTGPIQTVS